MKKTILFLFLLLISPIFAADFATTSVGSGEDASMPEYFSGSVVDSSRGVVYMENTCNISESSIDSIKDFVELEMNMSGYNFSNITSSYCYSYSDYNSLNVNILFKEEESSIAGKVVSVNLYSSTAYDYDVIFTSEENEALDYTLKQMYAEYLISGKDEEFYVALSPFSLYSYEELSSDACSSLTDYFETLSGEKYYNENDYYCSIILKTKSSEIKNLLQSPVKSVQYFSDSVMFSFTGSFEGSFNLNDLSSSLNCDLSKNDYYYPSFESECYGIYKDKSRVYFSISEDFTDYWVNLYVYGIIDGKAQLTASAYGENLDIPAAQNWVDHVLAEYFPGRTLSLTSSGEEYQYLSGEVLVEDFTFDASLVSGLKTVKDAMNTYYQGENIYVTVSEPYIELMVNSPTESLESIKILPYYSGERIVITSTSVYSQVLLERNDESAARSELDKIVSPYVTPGDWSLKMSVTGNYYVMPLGARESDSSASQEVSSAGFSGVRDALSAEHPNFSELEEEPTFSIIEWVINFFKSLI